MATFGSFVYGSGVVYGPSSTITSIDILRKDMIRVVMVEPVVVNVAYNDPTNYSITLDGASGSLRVRRVLASNTTTTREIILVTDFMEYGLEYVFAFSGGNVVSTSGSPLVGGGSFIARYTKTDSINKSIPGHFDKRPESIIESLLIAFSIEDERIGGSRNEFAQQFTG